MYYYITACVEPREGPGALYFNENLEEVPLRDAKGFLYRRDAIRFAEENNIELDGISTYIVRN